MKTPNPPLGPAALAAALRLGQLTAGAEAPSPGAPGESLVTIRERFVRSVLPTEPADVERLRAGMAAAARGEDPDQAIARFADAYADEANWPEPMALDYAQSMALNLLGELIPIVRLSDGAVRIVRTAGELQACLDTGVFAMLLYDSIPLGLVMTAAMTLNLLVAALFGVFIPMLMVKLGRDPAVGSSVLITAITDSGGFFIFLGLATLILL